MWLLKQYTGKCSYLWGELIYILCIYAPKFYSLTIWEVVDFERTSMLNVIVVVVWMRIASLGSNVWMLDLSWQNCLGRIRRYDLVEGGASLRVDFEKLVLLELALSVLWSWIECNLSATAPVLCLPAYCPASYHDDHGLILWKCEPQIICIV